LSKVEEYLKKFYEQSYAYSEFYYLYRKIINKYQTHVKEQNIKEKFIYPVQNEKKWRYVFSLAMR